MKLIPPKLNESIYVLFGRTYYSGRQTSQELAISLRQVQKKIKEGSIHYVKMNDRIFIPEWSIAVEKFNKIGKVEGYEVSPSKNSPVAHSEESIFAWTDKGVIGAIKYFQYAFCKPIVVDIEKLTTSHNIKKQPGHQVREYCICDNFYIWSHISTQAVEEPDKRLILGQDLDIDMAPMMKVMDLQEWQEFKGNFLKNPKTTFLETFERMKDLYKIKKTK